ncbi:tyrosine-protein phosphatase [Tropicimonas sp.]|uniref:tyrosine-protein phosphatase n=1 Tax=Tropicimonas sp. TaxID=2067044 RepID=UPI003A85CB42
MRAPDGADLSDPAFRRRAWWHFQLFDHAALRILWSNFDKVADGVYRSNQPSPAQLRRYRERGIVAVLNLRGADGNGAWLFEEEACRALGLELRVARIYARRAAKGPEITRLIDTMRDMPRPFVMHCKSGADRAGLAAVLYKVVIEGAPLAEARRHLSMRYLHSDRTATGIVDHIFDLYEARNAEEPIGMETWFRTEYDHAAVTRSFERKHTGGR